MRVKIANRRHFLQDTLPPGSITAFHRSHPEFASIAVPQKPGEGLDLAAMMPPDPTRPPTVEEHVTIPRGYLEYLEAFVNEHLSYAAAADGSATAATAAAGTEAAPAEAVAAAPGDGAAAGAAVEPTAAAAGGGAVAEVAPVAEAPVVAADATAPVGAVGGVAGVTAGDSVMVDAPAVIVGGAEQQQAQ